MKTKNGVRLKMIHNKEMRALIPIGLINESTFTRRFSNIHIITTVLRHIIGTDR